MPVRLGSAKDARHRERNQGIEAASFPPLRQSPNPSGFWPVAPLAAAREWRASPSGSRLAFSILAHAAVLAGILLSIQVRPRDLPLSEEAVVAVVLEPAPAPAQPAAPPAPVSREPEPAPAVESAPAQVPDQPPPPVTDSTPTPPSPPAPTPPPPEPTPAPEAQPVPDQAAPPAVLDNPPPPVEQPAPAPAPPAPPPPEAPAPRQAEPAQASPPPQPARPERPVPRPHAAARPTDAPRMHGPLADPPRAARVAPSSPATGGLSGPVIPPRPVAGMASDRPPVYPELARRRGEQGRVLVRVSVSADGTPLAVGVGQSSGHASLDTAAVTAVRGWRFMPATQAGRPVPASAEVPVQFQLEN